MPLKLRIKPEGKFFVNGATLKNVSSSAIDILVIEGEAQREERLPTPQPSPIPYVRIPYSEG